MERTDILGLMGELKLYGMQTAYDEVMGTGIKRQHEPPRIVGDLLSAEIAESRHARSNTNSRPRSCRSQRISTTSTSPARLSMRPLFAISLVGP